MENAELYTQKLTRGKRSYFFDIKQTEQKDFYIKITESKKSIDGFEHHRIMVFEEDITEFTDAFRQCLNGYRKLKEVQTVRNRPATFIEIREKYPKAYIPWTTEEDDKLEFLYCEGKKVNEMALILERKKGAIESRIKKMGLKEKYGE